VRVLVTLRKKKHVDFEGVVEGKKSLLFKKEEKKKCGVKTKKKRKGKTSPFVRIYCR